MKRLFVLILFTSFFAFNKVNAAIEYPYKADDAVIENLFAESSEIEYSNLSEIQGILLPTASLPAQLNDDNKKIIAGLLGIFCGSLGLHRFYLGHNQSGFIYLGATLVSGVAGIFCPFLWAVPSVVGLLGLIDGIMILIDETGTKYNDKKKLIMWMDK
ncbi:MAG: TM2 domain-containing protein [Bacteroidota bacterium]|jgi:TM2 domain-containing membrane protein YozV